MQNLNDNAPIISVLDPKSFKEITRESEFYMITRLENQPRVNDSFVLIKVSDADLSFEYKPTCEPVESSYFKLLSSTTSGQYNLVYKLNTYDRETKAVYIVYVACSDNAIKDGLRSSIEIRLVLLDANDNQPIFTKENYHASVPSNNAKGSYVTIVTARDDDIKQTMNYEIDESHADTFSVDQTGVITLRKHLNHQRYQFNVHAYDVGKLKGSAVVIVTVTKENSFKKNFYTFSIKENNIAGAIVGNLKREGYSHWILLDKVPFEISRQGLITTKKVLDSESDKEVFVFKVQSKLKGFLIQSNVEIKLIDVNEYRPTFTFPVDGNETCLCREVGVMCVVSAEDKDRKHEISYSLMESSDMFSIDPQTGSLSCLQPLTSGYTVSIRVHSGEHNQLAALSILAYNGFQPNKMADSPSNRMVLMTVVLVSLVIALSLTLIGCFVQRQKTQKNIKKSKC